MRGVPKTLKIRCFFQVFTNYMNTKFFLDEYHEHIDNDRYEVLPKMSNAILAIRFAVCHIVCLQMQIKNMEVGSIYILYVLKYYS